MKIELAYQTQNIPAPFAYSVLIQADLHQELLNIDFDLSYLDRDTLSEQEIVNEGFSLADDFKWSGNLGGYWNKALLTFQALTYGSEPSEDFYLHVKIDGIDQGFPTDADDLLVQELIQAVYEVAEKELPLMITFFDKSETKVQWKFASREVLINDLALHWKHGERLMQAVFTSQIDEVQSIKHPKTKSISLEEDYWLPIADDLVWKELKALQNTAENS